MIRNPIRFSRTPARYDSPPPALGEHDTLIRDWLARPIAQEGPHA
jgi:crotonobetainyl-CoA:carnitine CoA-transferase CaiB-like acyl-CoA transferase